MNPNRNPIRAAVLMASAMTGLGITTLAAAHQGGPYGQGARSGPGPRAHMMERHAARPMMRMERLSRALDLTDDQQATIRERISEARNALSPLREQLRENQRALREAARPATYDEGAVAALAQAHGELQAEMILERSRVRAAIHEVLTTEQAERLDELRDRRGRR